MQSDRDLVTRSQRKPDARAAEEADAPIESRSPETDGKIPRELDLNDGLNRLSEDPQSSLQQLDTRAVKVSRPDRLLRGRLSLPSSPWQTWAEAEPIDREAEREEYEHREE